MFDELGRLASDQKLRDLLEHTAHLGRKIAQYGSRVCRSSKAWTDLGYLGSLAY